MTVRHPSTDLVVPAFGERRYSGRIFRNGRAHARISRQAEKSPGTEWRVPGEEAPLPCSERRAALTEWCRGGTRWRYVDARQHRHAVVSGGSRRDQVFQLSAVSSSDDSLCQLAG